MGWNVNGGGDASIVGDNGNIVIITDNKADDSGIPIADVELNTNKSTAFQVTPDDIKYPSEKLVKDSLDLKMDKVATATEDNIATFGSQDQVVDSGIQISDVEINTNKTATFQVTPNDIKYPTEKLVKDSLDLKMDKVSTATEDNVIIFDEFGNAKDSGFPASKLDPIIDGTVATFSALPTASAHNAEIWLVTTTTGTIYINRKVAGLYISNGTEWSLTTPVDIDGYQKIITPLVTNNIVKTDANGQTQDAGVAVSIDGTMASNSDAKLPTEKAVRTFLKKTETSVTKYVSDLSNASGDSNDGNTRFTPYLTVAKAWTDITPSGTVNVLGSSTYSASHIFNGSKTSIKTVLEGGAKLTGTILLVAGNTSMQFLGGKIQATINDSSTGTTYFNNVDMSGSSLTFSGGGYKQITNSPSTPTMITLSNLASGSGTLELNNVIGGVVGISVGTGWTVLYRNTIIATVGAVNGVVVEANNVFCNAILASQSQLNAISTDGYYILNFASPTITGVTVAKGDVIYKTGSTMLCVYKFSFAPAVLSVLKPLNPAQRLTYAKSSDGWAQLDAVNPINLQATKTIYVDSTYGSNSNDGLSISTKVQTISGALAIAGNNWGIEVVSNEALTYTGSIGLVGLSIKLAPNASLSGTTTLTGVASVKYLGGRVQATINDSSTGNTYFDDVNLLGAALTFSAGGYKQISNSQSPPNSITLSNLASGSGTLELNSVLGGVVNISVGAGWTVLYRNTMIATVGAVDGIVIESNNNVGNAVLIDQSELNAISTDGFYIINFASPTVSGLSVAKGDIIYKLGSTKSCVYKFSSAPTVFSISNPSDPDQRFTWAKSSYGWIQVGGVASVAWGGISGTLSSQTDLQTALNAKENSITNLPVSKGGVGINSLTGNALRFMRVNSAATGYEFSNSTSASVKTILNTTTVGGEYTFADFVLGGIRFIIYQQNSTSGSAITLFFRNPEDNTPRSMYYAGFRASFFSGAWSYDTFSTLSSTTTDFFIGRYWNANKNTYYIMDMRFWVTNQNINPNTFGNVFQLSVGYNNVTSSNTSVVISLLGG